PTLARAGRAAARLAPSRRRDHRGTMRRLATGVGLGLILGWAAAHALFLHWWTLVPWGLAGLALGYRARRAGAVTAGAGYGFVLCFVFTLVSYGGAAPAITRIPFFTVLG